MNPQPPAPTVSVADDKGNIRLSSEKSTFALASEFFRCMLCWKAPQEALVYGEGRFATMSASMAEAMRVNADELARDDPEKAERVLQQASAMMAQFKAAYPHRVVSRSLH
ncbi:hypothetical protein Rleg9DRAFT_6039 [Rhizobium leguminosarum bv. trifolii WSM597]|uniref:Uncharacterized protein n=1 Tax=Rhizobium leguminosarum bv. trifolii WSM597 TaxID=754764 RepID=J0H9M9_RHILT|nr:hypothetical protein [Rhizobium leguminosarum]EJB07063.1 hypothetical protein Rleg9DRAFT_6039 [Rhizobium leguminosarum bv. trifolii WSM597]